MNAQNARQAPSAAGLCPLDGAPMQTEMLDEFHICSKCREILYEHELVEAPTHEAQQAYLQGAYPAGYDNGELPDFRVTGRAAALAALHGIRASIQKRLAAFRRNHARTMRNLKRKNR